MCNVPWGALTLLTLFFAFPPATAIASHGGPQLVRVLGWDPRDHKIFFLRELHDESGEPGGIWYFDLKSRTPTVAVRAHSLDSRGLFMGKEPLGGLAPLRSRLWPMNPVPLLRIVASTEVLGEDSLEYMSCRRFRLKVTIKGTGGGWQQPRFDPLSLECVTYGDSRVALASAQSAEGALLLVLAYRGVPHEECYEYHHAVLVPLKP